MMVSCSDLFTSRTTWFRPFLVEHQDRNQHNSLKLDSKFHRIKTLGEGTYGVVYEAIQVSTGKKYALKKLRIPHNHSSKLNHLPTTALREVILLREIRHPNIVRLYQAAHIQSQLWLCFELCDLDLRQYLKQHMDSSKQMNKKMNKPLQYFLPLEQCKSLIKQLLQGVAYCHSRRIIHRDLKPQNLLLDAKGSSLKIADFGLARVFSAPMQQYTHEVVTLWYRPPELLLGDDHYTSALDLWSVGCIIYEITTGKPLFRGDSEIDTLYRIFRVLGTPTDTVEKSEKSKKAPWSGVSTLKYYNSSFPRWECDARENILNSVPQADPLLADLLWK